MQHLVTEVACETCPINQLPRESLHSDLSQGQGGPLGMPCRVAPSASSGRCIHGLAANDPVDVRVPWEWSEHPDVEKDGSDYRVKRVENLLTAWEAQAAASDQPSETTSPSPPKDTPVVKQRSITAQYMKLHEQFGLHPFATSCDGCRHKLDKSPTKDESVPHCAWAGRLRGADYTLLTSELEGAPEILVCRQYAPNQPWCERIPAHPKPAGNLSLF